MLNKAMGGNATGEEKEERERLREVEREDGDGVKEDGSSLGGGKVFGS